VQFLNGNNPVATSPRYPTALTIVIISILLSINIPRVQANLDPVSHAVDASPANLPWASQYAQWELDRDVGGFVSAALLPFNNFLAISYYDATHHWLMGATPVIGHLGNCGTDNNWVCLSIDNSGDDVGMFSSIDLWGASIDNWKMGFSYYDATHRSLKAAIYHNYYGDNGWDIQTVGTPLEPKYSVGYYSSFKFDSTGNAGIAYSVNNSDINFDILAYAEQVPGGGNCGGDLWKCEGLRVIDANAKYASLDYDYEDTAYIAYYDANLGNLDLTIQGGTCGSTPGWSCEILDDSGADDVGLFPSLIAPQYPGDIYRIAYHDRTNGHLKYYDPVWEDVVVDDMGQSIAWMGVSMILDDAGHPAIAYQKITDDFAPPELSLARPAFVYGADYGNCGDAPPGYLFTYWQCKTLDNGSQFTEEADFASIVMNSSGLLAIAYTEYDSYNDFTSVKFIYQHMLRTFIPISGKE
jgi:hypothetical protein